MPVEQSQQGPRRSRGLEDIAPQYVAQSGLCASSEMESPRGSLRIRHLISSSPSSNADEDQARFPRLDQCAHFHYDQVDLPPLQVSLYNEELKSLSCDATSKCLAVQVRSHGASWLLRRSYENFKLLDQQLHRCIYDRKFSLLPCLPDEEEDEASVRDLLESYLSRFSHIAGNLINCGPVLNWLELDNRGRRLLVPDNDNCPINTPAVAAAYSVRQYSAQAGDEISFEVGDMISVIDMPPPEESVWWRGKRGFQVGFFPGSCVAVIGDKLPRSLLLPASVASLALGGEPSKPVLRKHGKLIAFFRSFILARPSRRRLKQSGILKERVFGCDLGEHLLNSGHQVPMVLKCCAEFIESHGIVDGIYRLSGVTSNIQKLRNAFDEDRVPGLYEDEAILQDIHSVASLLKMYFRELPNPLCTYQLYHAFVGAVGSAPDQKLLRMREAVAKLPPPHYRTLEYLMRHLARVAERGHMTGMTPRNVAIVWAPNLLRCKELEVGGVAALQGVGIQAVVTEFLVCYADLIFCDNLPVVVSLPPIQASPKRCRPKSLAISTPTRLLSLEEARTRALNTNAKGDTDYIEVGGGPSKLPAKYHTVIELPRKRSSSKRSPLGWKSLFGKSGRKNSIRKSSTPTDLGLHQESAVTESDLSVGRRRLRPVKSAESLNSGAESSRNSAALDADKSEENGGSPPAIHQSQASLTRAGHNRSASHDSYFDGLDTPVHARLSTRPSRLQEMDNEDSSLDLSEIQINFDLEDSEMRIFSEDETLVSTSVGSGSIMSHNNSPRVRRSHQPSNVSVKRLPCRQAPRLAHPEDPLSSCPSLDPSPKKQKTHDSAATSPTDSTRSKRSRLEEQLASSTGELRYIDSQSPDNTVVVRAEVHPTSSYSLSDSESYDRLSATTTPDTPVLVYTPLVDRDSNCSTSMTASPSSPPCRTLMMSQSSSLDFPYNRLSAPNLTPNSSLSGNATPTANLNEIAALAEDNNVFRYEIIASRRPDYENVPVTPTIAAYQNLPADKIVIRTSVSPLASPVKESLITIKYENVKSPRAKKEFVYEAAADTSEGYWEGEWDAARIEAEKRDEQGANVYQNLPSTLKEDGGDEHVYEDVQLLSDSPAIQEVNPPPATQEESPPEVVYQQVKYLRRSIHEINQLLEEALPESPSPLPESPTVLPESLSVSPEATPPRDEFHQIVFVSGEENSSSDQQLSETDRDFPEYENLTLGDSPPQDNESRVVVVGSERSESLDSVSGFECENLTEDDSTRLDFSLDIADEEYEKLVMSPISESLIEEPEKCVTLTCESVSENTSGPYSVFEIVPEDRQPTRDIVGDSCASRETENGDQSQNCDNINLNLDEINDTNVTSDEHVMDKVTSEEHIMDKVSSEEHIMDKVASEEHIMDSSIVSLSSVESSPAHEPEQSKRRIESEIGRDILRERKMRQELEEVRFTNLGSRRPGSIKDLLSKFETSPTKDMDIGREFHSLTEAKSKESVHDGFSAVTPKLHRRYGDAGSLPPCVRARAAKTARKLANSTSLSVSLDGDQFVAANNENQIVRVLTSPDIGKDGLESEPRQESGVLKPLNAIDDDPQRRERIERYKEERRLFLREKYRSESFKGDRDEILQRLKVKAAKTLSSPDEPMDTERTFSKANERVRCNSLKGSANPSEETKRESDETEAAKNERLGGSTLERAKRSGSRYKCPEVGQLEAVILGRSKKTPSEVTSRLSGSPEKRPTDGPITCVLVKERTSSDRMTVTMGLKSSKTKESDAGRRYTPPRNTKEVFVAPSRTRLGSNPESPSHKSSCVVPRPSSVETASVERSWRSRSDVTSPTKSRTPVSPARTQQSWGSKPSSVSKSPEPKDSKSPPWRTEAKRPTSIETTSPIRRDVTSKSPTEPEATRRKSSGSGSPSYCIRDMAAIFENRDSAKSTGRPQVPNKQYLSSM